MRDGMYTDVRQVLEQVEHIILGKREEIREIMTAFLANGHVLLEDIPGVGKTTLAMAFSEAMQLEHKRIQFTPDVMPSDFTGFSIYQREQEKFVYQPGSVFCNLLLADELNRTSPKTQSALLEVMEERKVTVEGITREVPAPFLVIATQNPSGTAGTQYLPEAQVDRFMVSLSLGYPDYESELEMAKTVSNEARYKRAKPVLAGPELIQIQDDISRLYMKDNVCKYALELVRATRNHPDIERGASPRATIGMIKLAKASAWLEGRDYVTPADVSGQFVYAVSHRILLKMAAERERKTKRQILEEIIRNTQMPQMGEESR